MSYEKNNFIWITCFLLSFGVVNASEIDFKYYWSKDEAPINTSFVGAGKWFMVKPDFGYYSEDGLMLVDKDGRYVKPFDNDKIGKKLYGFQYGLYENKLYVSAYSVEADPNDSSKYFCIIHLYILDENYNIVKEKTFENRNASSSSFNGTYEGHCDDSFSCYNYFFRYNEGYGLFLYDGALLNNKYYKVDANLEVVEVTEEEANISKFFGGWWSTIQDRIKNDIASKYKADYEDFEIKTYVDRSMDNSKYIAKTTLTKSTGPLDVNKKVMQAIAYYDTNGKEIFSFIVNKLDEIDTSKFNNLGVPIDSLKKTISVSYKEFDDYFMVFGIGANETTFYLIDKEGKVLKDYSNDIPGTNMGLSHLIVNEHSFMVYFENQLYSVQNNIVNYSLNFDDSVRKLKVLAYSLMYSATIKESKNGTLTIAKNIVYPNEEVSLEVKPDEGYELGEIKIVDSNGNVISTKESKFIMPGDDVTIEAVFVEKKIEEVVINPETRAINIISIILIILVTLGIALIYKKKKEFV